MITNDLELKATLDRIRRLQEKVAHLRTMETKPVNYRLAASGFRAEVDRRRREVRESLSLPPAESAASA